MTANMYRTIIRLFMTCLLCILVIQNQVAIGDTIKLTVPSFRDGIHSYYHALLRNAVENAGHEIILNIPSYHVPQKRAVGMLAADELSLFWLIQSAIRDEQYTPVEVGITNNLIGHRILFIPENAQPIYDAVNSLDDFRQLNKVGGFGKNWFDVKVWQANQLKVFELDGEWRNLYRMVARGGRNVDYFSRGFNEILLEAKQNPFLDIEKRLMFIYDRDFRFYLSKTAAQYKTVLETALKQYKEQGLMDKLIRDYWADNFQKLDFDNRIKIKLITPN